jgi:hypothetical protein
LEVDSDLQALRRVSGDTELPVLLDRRCSAVLVQTTELADLQELP